MRVSDTRIADIEARVARFKANPLGPLGKAIDDLLADRKDLLTRQEALEEAITNASLALCRSKRKEAVEAMRIFNAVMDEAARKRVGI